MRDGCKCDKEKRAEPGDYYICMECLPDDLYDDFISAQRDWEEDIST